MLLKSNISIRQHLTSMIMLISTISVLITTATISIIGVYNLQRGLQDEMAITASIVGDRNSAMLRFEEYKRADENLEKIFDVYPSVMRACLYNDQGMVAAKYMHQNTPLNQCPADVSSRNVITDKYIDVMQPVSNFGDVVGYIFIESDLKEVENYIKKQSTIAIIVIFAVLLVSYFLAVNLQKTISTPILSLAQTAHKVSEEKDYSIRAAPFAKKPAGTENEIYNLTQAFNDMLSQIEQRNTRLKQQNIELEMAKDAAEAASRAKSQFLANVSHELRTPLNAIIGFSSILMNQLFGDLGDEKYLDYANDINDSGTHLLDIINDILDLSKAEAGSLELNFEEVHVPKAIKKCVTLLGEKAQKGGIEISTSVPKNLSPLTVDRLRFIQIIMNILSNSIKFTEEGGKVDIAVETRSKGEETTHFIVTMKDTGIGMSEEDIQKAFQSFGQIDGGLDRKYEGTGLGLPLTKKLVEIHHGQLNITSELGVGTQVTITLPAIPPGEFNA